MKIHEALQTPLFALLLLSSLPESVLKVLFAVLAFIWNVLPIKDRKKAQFYPSVPFTFFFKSFIIILG